MCGNSCIQTHIYTQSCSFSGIFSRPSTLAVTGRLRNKGEFDIVCVCTGPNVASSLLKAGSPAIAEVAEVCMYICLYVCNGPNLFSSLLKAGSPAIAEVAEVCMHVCMYVCVFSYHYTYINAYTYIHTYIHTQTHTDINTYIYTRTER